MVAQVSKLGSGSSGRVFCNVTLAGADNTWDAPYIISPGSRDRQCS